MKIAVIGSRNLTVDLSEYVPEGTTAIISGGAKGIDTCAANYAKENGLELIEFLPDYKKYGRGAPLKRNDLIIDAADIVLAFWDGKSRGTKYGIDRCKKLGKEVRVFILK
jgi:hypothetical protein